MKSITRIARNAPAVIFLFSILSANAAPPARFSGQVGQSVTYNVKIQVGTGNDADAEMATELDRARAEPVNPFQIVQ